jgi:Cu(I)/Ag(I) efflux system membrane fusion protein
MKDLLMKNIFRKTLFPIFFAILISILNWNCTSSHNEQSKTEEHAEHKTNEFYTCPMHPSVQSDRPGACPVCGMALVKKSEETVALSHDEQQSVDVVAISPSKQTLANVEVSVAMKMKLKKEIRAVGKINYAEPNFKLITMRFPGRLEKMYINCRTGTKINVGDAIADIYSPEAISAQKEFLLALKAYEEVQQNGIDLSDAQNLFQQVKEKLQRWGFTEEQISSLQDSKAVNEIVTIYSPVKGTVIKNEYREQYYAKEGEVIVEVVDLSKVWMYVYVYENEMRFIEAGQKIIATTEAYPEEEFTGKLIYISSQVDVSARTVRVRVEFLNQNEKLKLDMFMNAAIQMDLQEEVVVPQSAVISTGNRNVVFVQKDKNIFEPRRITLGASAENYVQIISGIEEGETIATSGGYLLDSESQLHMGMGMGTSDHAQHGGAKMETNSNKENQQQHQH